MDMRGSSRAFMRTITPAVLAKANAKEFSPGLLATAQAIVETFASLMTLHFNRTPNPYAVQAGINYIAKTLLHLDKSLDTVSLPYAPYESSIREGMVKLMKIFGLNSEQGDALLKNYKQICTGNITESNNLFQGIQCLLYSDACPTNILSILQQPNQIKILNLGTWLNRLVGLLFDRAIQTLSNILVHPECRLKMLYFGDGIRIGPSIEHLRIALQNPACNLSTIYFGNNMLEDSSLQALAQAIQNPSCQLTSIYLASPGWLASSALLQTERFYGNKFTQKGLQALAQAVFSQGRTKIYIGADQVYFNNYLRELELQAFTARYGNPYEEPKPDTSQFKSLTKF